jgi:hypothetical protein
MRALLAVVAAIAIAALFTPRVVGKMADFEVYWTAGTRALSADPLYRTGDGHFQFKYLPAFALAMMPLSLMPLVAAKVLWFWTSLATLAALLWLSVAALPERRMPVALLAGLTFLAMVKFYAHELVLGQVNLLFAVTVMAAVLLAMRGRPVATGLLFAAAIVVKPYGVLFAPWLLWRWRAREMGAWAAGLLAVLLLPTLVYGWSGNAGLLRDWWTTVASSTPPNLLNQDNVSPASMAARLGWVDAAPLVGAIASVALLGVAAATVTTSTRAARPEPLDAALLLTLVPLLSPQGWDYAFLIATPAVMLLIDFNAALPAALRAVTIAAIAVSALTVYDVVGRTTYAAFMTAGGITICFLVVIAALVWLRRRQIA